MFFIGKLFRVGVVPSYLRDPPGLVKFSPVNTSFKKKLAIFETV